MKFIDEEELLIKLKIIIMNRNIFYVILVLVIFTSSCKKDYDTDYQKLGADIVPAAVFTSLDDALKLDIKSFGTEEPIVVTHLGGSLKNGTPLAATQFTVDLGAVALDAEGLGTISIPEAKLGPNAIGNSFNLKFTIKNGGMETYRFLTVKVADPLTIGDSYKIVAGAKKAATVIEDATTYNVDYTFAPKNSTVSSVTVERKVGKNATYSVVAGTFNAAGKVSFKGNDFVKYDTIYYRFTATAAHTLVREKTIVVRVNSYTNLATVTMKPEPDTLSRFYDFQERVLIPDSLEVVKGDSVDIKYLRTDIMGNYNLGFDAPNNAVFIKVTGTPNQIAKVFTEADKVRIPTTDFTSAVKTIDNVQVGDVFLYRTNRNTSDPTFGVFRITEVLKPDADPTKSSFTFDLKN
ncbi:MAG: hypothetical protein EHM93_14445 [Bacteroidales bacterium]|nr:MAG: hypothetical protein EHM93_14445 [Bacteroidales bacterium]